MARRWLKLEENTQEELKGIPLSERTPSSIRFSGAEIRERMRVVIGRHVHFQPLSSGTIRICLTSICPTYLWRRMIEVLRSTHPMPNLVPLTERD
jgi:hypothetical protein